MKILSSKTEYTCPIFRVEERQVEVGDGVVQTHWVVVAKPNVSVVALTSDKKIIFNKELRSPNFKPRIELPSGKTPDFSITEDQAREHALKELVSESGYAAKNIKLLNIASTGSSYFSRQYYQFAAWDLEFVGQKLEPGEKIEAYLVSIQEAEDLIKHNKINSVGEQEAIKKGIQFFRQKGLI